MRAAAFSFLSAETGMGSDTVSWSRLTSGLIVDGRPVTLIGQKGIWRPAGARLPISITTAPPKPGRPAPYEDEITDDGYLRYAYEGTDPAYHRNVWLRDCIRYNVPLIYFHGVAKGEYLASWPVFIVADHPAELAVTVMLADPGVVRPDLDPSTVEEAERRYYLRLTKQRLHQATFRTRVLNAYSRRCTVCRLKHSELLDAAHILPDYQGGRPVVPNGLSLCKIHHSAFDHRILGIRPDHTVEIREDILREKDGPMLRHGLQATHGAKLWLPRQPHDRPDPDALEQRYLEFRSA